MTHREITVSVAGGRELDRAGLEALLTSLPGLRVVSLEVNPTPQVLVWIRGTTTHDPSLVVPGTAILLLTDDTEFESLPETITGLFSKDEPSAALSTAIRQVARGEQYLSPSLATAILEKRQARSLLTDSERSIIETLTEREREILNQLAKSNSRLLEIPVMAKTAQYSGT